MPLFVARASDVDPLDRPVIITLEISERADFAGTPLLEQSVQNDSARIVPAHPLPEGRTIFWRARLRTARGQDILSASDGPHTTATWVHLVSPNGALGGTLNSRRPAFRWSAAAVPSPPGPWQFFVNVENLGSHQLLRFGPITDSTFIPPVDLETNTSYRWSVTAGLPTGDSTTARSAASFVIVDPNSPVITLLYQNFPNPFPTATSATTCIWFDLNHDSRVDLSIHDIRGNLLRSIVPSVVRQVSVLPAGRYGRGGVGTTENCDPAYQWDGRDDGGRFVPTGVYLVRLKTDTYEAFKKILFRGR
jgi:hypothetical protein